MSDVFLTSEVHDFLRGRQVFDKGHEFSLTAMGDVKGKWFVSDADYPGFLDVLHRHLFVKRLRPLNLVEQRKADGITPLTIDLDFRYPAEKALTRAFNIEMIQGFLQEVLNVLKDCFEMKGRTALRFFVTLRPQPYQDRKNVAHKKEIKDGIHIMCPDFTLNAELQGLVRHRVLEANAITTCFGATGFTNKPEDVFDKSLVGAKANGWMFYGESKQDIPPYELKHIFKYIPSSGRLTQESCEHYTPRQLMEELSIRYNLRPQFVVREAVKEDIYKQIAELAKPAPKPAATTAEGGGTTNELIEIGQSLWEPYIRDVLPDSELKLAKRLALECLSADRADSFESWMRVGWCLRNIDSSEDMFKTWMEFSAKSGKSGGNNVEQLRRQWLTGSMRRDIQSGTLRMGSLHRWAREDNCDKYKEIMDADVTSYIRKVAVAYKGGTHHHVAQIMYKLFHERFTCAIGERNVEWYEFKNHGWYHCVQGIALKERIHNEVATHVGNARNAPINKDNEEQELKYRQLLLDFEKNLYSASFKENILKECVQLFYDEQFGKKLNQNPYMLGCANGVLHLRHTIYDEKGTPIRRKPTLLPGKPSDYVSLQVGITADGEEALNYVPYDPADPRQEEIMDFFKKLFPADDLREYVLTLAAGCLEGANLEQCFYFMTGSGGNGKSKFVDLMSSIFGQYGGSLSTTAMTRKRPESGAANPDVITLKGCRFIDMKEPDENEPVNTARMKQFSGEDFVEARGLYKDQERFKITGKIFLACNRLPPIYSMDGGTWRRVRVIPFNSRFVPKDDPAIDIKNHIYPRDDMLTEKLKSWREPFFSLLVHYYETRYCPDGIKRTPAVVMEACNTYKNTHDAFAKFIGARVRKDNDSEATFPELLKVYKTWHKEEGSGARLKDNEFKIRLNDMYGTPIDGKTYKRIRVFLDEQDVEEFDKESEAESESASTA